MRLIPAIDIINGKCVRLTKGDYRTQKVYNENPLEVAKAFEDNGIQYVHVVDLDGAKSKHIVNTKILEDICTNTHLKVDFGGGLKSNKDVEIAFNSGANQVTAGSIAVTNPEKVSQWINQYGNERIILGADCNNQKIATNGWIKESDIDVIDFIKSYESKKIQYVICTDIAKDGMLEGTSNTLYQQIIAQTNVKLIASGGVSSIEDLKRLKVIGCEAAIIGKAIYEGKIKLNQLKEL